MARTETQVSAQPSVVASTLHGDSENSSHQQTPGTARHIVGWDRQTTVASTNIRLGGARPRQSSISVAAPAARSTSAPGGDCNMDDGGDDSATWSSIVSRHRRQVINGTGTAETAQKNAERLRIQSTTKIIVSRLDPATTEAELTDYVKDVVGVTLTNCTKFKSKFDTYSSFVRVVLVDVKDSIRWVEMDGWYTYQTVCSSTQKADPKQPSLGNVL